MTISLIYLHKTLLEFKSPRKKRARVAEGEFRNLNSTVAELCASLDLKDGENYSALHNPLRTSCRAFPGGRVDKKPPANAGDMGSSPGPGRFHMPRSN